MPGLYRRPWRPEAAFGLMVAALAGSVVVVEIVEVVVGPVGWVL